MHKIFTLFKPVPYLLYYPEYKKPAAATNFPAIIDCFFLTEVHCGLTVSGEPHHEWWWGQWEAKGIL